MRKKDIEKVYKNAMGTVFLLASMFFLCATFLSMRSVFADPITFTNDTETTVPQSSKAGTTKRSGSRTSPRNTSANRARSVTSRSAVTKNISKTGTTNSSNTVASRSVTSRSTVIGTGNSRRVNTRSTNTTTSKTRNLTSRSNAASARNVKARTATNTDVNSSRVSLQGSAIRGSKTTSNSTYTYISNRLYNTNYSNIIDSTTGLISADAYNDCVESYYACMDEICTARNSSQGRCSCAGRAKSFAEAEEALETANEELIKVSGELALLVANNGKDVSDAFQLTEAEQVMNCVSWQETTGQYGTSSDEAQEWCYNHGFYSSDGASGKNPCSKPSYCSSSGNSFDFDIDDIEGSGSDILASLKSWADAKESASKILLDDDDNLLSSYTSVNSIVSDITSTTSSLTDTSLDSLANTWGYDLFEYAHNNVCSRVLDSCFNGIYEACGTPPSGGKCATSATSSCPFNYNSNITVSSSGDVTLNERNSSSSTANSTATCLGYSSSSGDPYTSLRGPVADARRSVMQKYLLDANAACDTYGDTLRSTAQNIAYQKAAAEQSLQQKRLEFANNERDTILTEAVTAGTNFNECISEIYDCYEDMSDEDNWTTARIKTYCAQISQVPHCYETMICNPSSAQFKAVIDKQDSSSCKWTQDYTTNTCRNVVTLNEILNGTGVTAVSGPYDVDDTYNSAGIREKCLLDAIGSDANNNVAIRSWTKPSN